MSPILGDNDLNLGISGGSGLPWLLRDEFTTPAGAPLTSPRTCEPGPGTLTITDTGNKLSISGGKLQWGASAAANDPKVLGGTSYARLAGRMFSMKYTHATNADYLIGWSNAATGLNNTYTLRPITNVLNAYDNGSNASIGVTVVNATDYTFYFVMKATGCNIFIKGDTFTVPTLVWVGVLDTTTPLYLTARNVGANIAAAMDSYRVRDLGGPFATDNGIATLNMASPVNANLSTGDADAVIDMTLTAAGTILTSGGVRFRVQDASNYWIMYFNTAGAFRVDSVSAGTPTNRVNVAGVITTSATRTMRCVVIGNQLNFYTLNASTWTKQGSTLTNAAFQTNNGVQPDFGADWTAANLRDFPAISSTYNTLDLS